MVCTINTFYMAVDICENYQVRNLRKLLGEQDKSKIEITCTYRSRIQDVCKTFTN